MDPTIDLRDNGSNGASPSGSSTATSVLGGPQDTSNAYHPHQTDNGASQGRGLTPTRRQLVLAIVFAAILISVTVGSVEHFASQPGEVDGVAQASQTFNLEFPAGGVVVQVLVKPGQFVHAGQLLAVQDGAVEQSIVEADRANVSADQAKLAAAQQQGQLTSSEQQGAVVLATQTAQKQKDQANGAVTAAQNQVNEAEQRLTNDQGTESADQRVESASCGAAGNTSSSSSSDCQSAQQRVNLDANQVALDTTALQAAQAALAEAQTAAGQANTVGAAQTNLATAQQSSKTDPTQFAAETSALQATLAQDQARLAQDLQAVTNLNMSAPSDGVVTEVNVVVGEYVSSQGVANTNGRTAFAQSQSTLNFLPPAPTSAQQAAPSQTLPTIRMYSTTGWTVMGQISESDVAPLPPGHIVKVQIPSLSRSWLTGTVEYVDGIPVQVQGVATNAGIPAQYDVLVALDQAPRGLLPGMRARINLTPPPSRRRA